MKEDTDSVLSVVVQYLV